MRTKEVDEAIDTLQNCIADYVIGDFCVGKYCPMENECKDKDCPFNTAIDKVVAYISELEEIVNSIDTQFIHKDKVFELTDELNKQVDAYNDAIDKFNKLLKGE